MKTKIYKTLDDAIGELDYKRLCDFLSMGIEGICYWGTTDYNEDEYRKSKAKLIDQKMGNVSWEEVLGQMLLDGYHIHIIDIEDGEESEYTKDLTLENLKKGISMWILNPKYHNGSDDWTDVDAVDGDIIMQFALFEDIIFG